KRDNKSLVITDLPYGKTTTVLIDSILKANDKGKIKIKKIDDNTADKVEIIVYLAAGTSTDKTIDALYAFTDCEISISPNSCVIKDDKPVFPGVNEMLKYSANNTVNLLTKELEIRKQELEDSWHLSSLEKIFIENRIYIDIEDCETWESIIKTIDKGLEPFKKYLVREVIRDDIIHLTEIKIKRISKYDSKKADEYIKGLEAEIDEVKNHLANIIPFTINYFKQIKKKYGKGKERKTEIRNFDTIVAAKVAASNAKLFVNRKEGFIGTGLKKDEFVCDCSDIDDIIIFRGDGAYIVSKVEDKKFVGKDIIHVAIFKKNDKRGIFNVVYRDGRMGNTMIKRCAITSVTRDKEYHITKGTPNSKLLYFSSNPNGEAEVIKVSLKPKPRLKKTVIEFDFSELAIKGKGSIGNILTKHAVQKILMKEKGESTLGGRKIWYDEEVNRLNAEGYGRFLGEFSNDNKILVMTRSGMYRLASYDLNNHFEDDVLLLEKFKPQKIFSVIYWDAEQEFYYVKRFIIDPVTKLVDFLNENHETKLISVTEVEYPRFEIEFGGKNKNKDNEIIEVAEFIGVKSYKA
ncbi:MAG: DNA gyrase/topoisomerase IV subunit A, partial [Bacteroidales bacterium]|nr:DNA gyrase/topoisomerase IV subunit A [Bacteroidales bacterium]